MNNPDKAIWPIGGRLSVIVCRPGLEPLVKRVAYDTPERQRLLTIELRKFFPEATLIPVNVRLDGELWAYSEKTVTQLFAEQT